MGDMQQCSRAKKPVHSAWDSPYHQGVCVQLCHSGICRCSYTRHDGYQIVVCCAMEVTVTVMVRLAVYL